MSRRQQVRSFSKRAQQMGRGLQAITEYEAAALSDEEQPDLAASSEIWAAYCNAAKGRAAAAIVEWGRRVQLAHDAYRAQEKCWGEWDDWCLMHLGIRRAMVSQLETISANLFDAVKQIDALPADTQSLYQLARFRRDNPAAFEAAIKKGIIRPGLRREDVRALLAADEEQQQDRAPAGEFRRVSGVMLSSSMADRLEAIAASRRVSPGVVITDVMEAWLRRQKINEYPVIDVSVGEG